MSDTPQPPRWVVPVVAAGAVAVVTYVTSWALAGSWIADYDPVRQAISELFAVGAPPGPSWLIRLVLVVTGLFLVPFAWALHVALPGEGITGPVLASLSGVATALVVLFPCTTGCPGLGASFTDTMHTLVAGVGYAALVLAPIAFGIRLRGHDDPLAVTSVVLGGIAAIGFLARAFGVGSDVTGLLQRIFNTLADVWYVLAAIAAVRYVRSGAPVDDG